MRPGLCFVLGAALAIGLTARTYAAVTDRCTKEPYGVGQGLNLQDFYYAYAALGRTVATAKQAVVMPAKQAVVTDTIGRLLNAASDLCHEASAFDKFTHKLPDRMRNDYRRITADLHDLGDTLAIATRRNDAATVNATVTQMQDDYAALSHDVPPRWLSAASTLHGARQPGGPLVLDW